MKGDSDSSDTESSSFSGLDHDTCSISSTSLQSDNEGLVSEERMVDSETGNAKVKLTCMKDEDACIIILLYI